LGSPDPSSAETSRPLTATFLPGKSRPLTEVRLTEKSQRSAGVRRTEKKQRATGVRLTEKSHPVIEAVSIPENTENIITAKFSQTLDNDLLN